MIRVFTLNKNGKIELTEKELRQLLDSVYWEGYRDNNKWTYTTPLTNTTPITYPYWSTSITSDSITLGTASAENVIK